MGNIEKVSSIDTSLNDTQTNLMPQKQIMERAKAKNENSFSDIYEVRQLTSDFNMASLESKRESLAYIRSQMQNIMQDISLTGVLVIKDITLNRQSGARMLIEN